MPEDRNATCAAAPIENLSQSEKIAELGLAFVLFSLTFFISYLIYNFIVFFKPDQIVGGAYALASGVVAVWIAFTKIVPPNIRSILGNFVYVLHANLSKVMIVTIVVWIAVVGWSVVMRRDVFGRFIYVTNLKKAMTQGAVDGASLPDSASLARAFSTFPNRREIPFLLTRSSRLLYQANRRDLFRAFQRQFIDALDVDNLREELCNQKEERRRFDGLLFLTAVAGEAYVPTQEPAAKGYRDEVASIINKLQPFVDSMKLCRQNSLEANTVRVLLEDTINEFKLAINEAAQFNIDSEITSLDDRIKDTKDNKVILRFWQSHEAQEYLDFKAYRVLQSINIISKKSASLSDADRSNLQKASSMYETLLLIRQSSLRAGDVIWNVPPFKLNLFYAFMLEANLKSLVPSDEIELFGSSPEVKSTMNEITSSKVFEQFRTPSGWYAGTPLDFNLNGSATIDKISAWLKEDW